MSKKEELKAELADVLVNKFFYKEKLVILKEPLVFKVEYNSSTSDLFIKDWNLDIYAYGRTRGYLLNDLLWELWLNWHVYIHTSDEYKKMNLKKIHLDAWEALASTAKITKRLG
jgi:hypothetical protein